MAQFDYNVTGTFQAAPGGGGFASISGLSNTTGTVFDSQSEGVGVGEFAPGELMAGVTGATTSTGAGTIVIDGVTFVIVGLNPITPSTTYAIFGYADDPATFVSNNPSPNVPISDYSDTGFGVCFAAGTRIATPEGERTVETLAPGDLVTTADRRAIPVLWIGRQTLHKLFTPADRFAPVRVTRGALGNGLPHSDLVLTAEHALILDGLAVNAGALVNGTSIVFEPVDSLPDRVTYYHVETAAHEIILANGAPAETYVDVIQRTAFDNHAERLALHGAPRTIPEMPLPRISAARLLPEAIRARLSARDVA